MFVRAVDSKTLPWTHVACFLVWLTRLRHKLCDIFCRILLCWSRKFIFNRRKLSWKMIAPSVLRFWFLERDHSRLRRRSEKKSSVDFKSEAVHSRTSTLFLTALEFALDKPRNYAPNFRHHLLKEFSNLSAIYSAYVASFRFAYSRNTGLIVRIQVQHKSICSMMLWSERNNALMTKCFRGKWSLSFRLLRSKKELGRVHLRSKPRY